MKEGKWKQERMKELIKKPRITEEKKERNKETMERMNKIN